jgi:hypothetical protein
MKIIALFITLLFSVTAFSQDQPSFSDIEAADELQDFSSLLANIEVDAGALNAARLRANKIASAATACAAENSATRARLEERLEPLREIPAEEASTESLLQRQSIRSSLDEAIARQARCDGLIDEAQSIISRISSFELNSICN